MIYRLSVISSFIVCTLSLICYDCYGSSPEECTIMRNCTGKACMTFDAGDGKAASAFCLLAMKDGAKMDKSTGCWFEPDGKGKHCICHTDYCNTLQQNIDAPTPSGPSDPLSLSIGGAEMLKQNPLIDYDTEEGDELNAEPAPVNVLFPGMGKGDPNVVGGEVEDDDDLVPINFEEYDQQSKTPEEKARTHENDIGDHSPHPPSSPPHVISSSFSPPPCLLLFLTMAASWARLFAGF